MLELLYIYNSKLVLESTISSVGPGNMGNMTTLMIMHIILYHTLVHYE